MVHTFLNNIEGPEPMQRHPLQLAREDLSCDYAMSYIWFVIATICCRTGLSSYGGVDLKVLWATYLGPH